MVKNKVETPSKSKENALSLILSDYQKKIETNELESVKGKVKKVSDGDTYVVILDKDSLSKSNIVDKSERQIKVRALLLDIVE